MTSTRGNSVQLVNLATGKVEQVSRSAWRRSRSCRRAGPLLRQQLGRRPAEAGRPAGRQLRHAGPRRSAHGVANHGTVSVLRPSDGKWRAGQDDPGRPAPQRHGRQPATGDSSTSPTPTATPSRSSTRTPTRSSRRSPAGPRAGCPSAAAATPWP